MGFNGLDEDGWNNVHQQAKKFRKIKIAELKERIAKGGKLTKIEKSVIEVWNKKYGTETRN